MSKVPIRFAKIEAGRGRSQVVAVMEGPDSISMAVRRDSREIISGITSRYNRLIRAVSEKLANLSPEGPAIERIGASKTINKFVKRVSSRFELVAFPESLARDLELKARQNEAIALLSLAKVARHHRKLSKRLTWRTFIFIHPAFEDHSSKGAPVSLIEDLVDVIDKQAAIAYRGNSYAAGSVSRQLFELALRHHLDRKL